MSYQDWLKAKEFMKNNPEDIDAVGEIDESLIIKAEAILNVKFPPSYRDFLKTFGTADWYGTEIYGLIDEDFVNSTIPDMVWKTAKMRKHGLPEHLIVIGDVGNGDLYCLDLKDVGSDGECSVTIWDHETESTGGMWDEFDFGEFVLYRLQEEYEL